MNGNRRTTILIIELRKVDDLLDVAFYTYALTSDDALVNSRIYAEVNAKLNRTGKTSVYTFGHVTMGMDWGRPFWGLPHEDVFVYFLRIGNAFSSLTAKGRGLL